MEKDKSIKKIGRKYLVPIIIASALAFGSNAYANNVKKEMRPFIQSVQKVSYEKERELKEGLAEKLSGINDSKERILEELSEPIKKCNESFNEGIEDGYYEESEQEMTLAYFNNLLDKDKKLDFYEYPSREREIYNLLKKNLHGYDLKIPELEKYLKKEGYSTNVQRILTGAEAGPSIFGGMFATLVIGALYHYFVNKLDKGEK